MGDEDGAAASSLRRLEARGVVCKLPDLGVGLLVGGCWLDRVERGVVESEPLVWRPLRFVGEDMVIL